MNWPCLLVTFLLACFVGWMHRWGLPRHPEQSPEQLCTLLPHGHGSSEPFGGPCRVGQHCPALLGHSRRPHVALSLPQLRVESTPTSCSRLCIITNPLRNVHLSSPSSCSLLNSLLWSPSPLALPPIPRGLFTAESPLGPALVPRTLVWGLLGSSEVPQAGHSACLLATLGRPHCGVWAPLCPSGTGVPPRLSPWCFSLFPFAVTQDV